MQLPTSVLDKATKRGCHFYKAENRIEICLKTRRRIIHAFRFVTIEGVLICDVTLRPARIIAAELTVYAATDVIEMLVQTFVVLHDPNS